MDLAHWQIYTCSRDAGQIGSKTDGECSPSEIINKFVKLCDLTGGKWF